MRKNIFLLSSILVAFLFLTVSCEDRSEIPGQVSKIIQMVDEASIRLTELGEVGRLTKENAAILQDSLPPEEKASEWPALILANKTITQQAIDQNLIFQDWNKRAQLVLDKVEQMGAEEAMNKLESLEQELEIIISDSEGFSASGKKLLGLK